MPQEAQMLNSGKYRFPHTQDCPGCRNPRVQEHSIDATSAEYLKYAKAPNLDDLLADDLVAPKVAKLDAKLKDLGFK